MPELRPGGPPLFSPQGRSRRAGSAGREGRRQHRSLAPSVLNNRPRAFGAREAPASEPNADRLSGLGEHNRGARRSRRRRTRGRSFALLGNASPPCRAADPRATPGRPGSPSARQDRRGRRGTGWRGELSGRARPDRAARGSPKARSPCRWVGFRRARRRTPADALPKEGGLNVGAELPTVDAAGIPLGRGRWGLRGWGPGGRGGRGRAPATPGDGAGASSGGAVRLRRARRSGLGVCVSARASKPSAARALRRTAARHRRPRRDGRPRHRHRHAAPARPGFASALRARRSAVARAAAAAGAAVRPTRHPRERAHDPGEPRLLAQDDVGPCPRRPAPAARELRPRRTPAPARPGRTRARSPGPTSRGRRTPAPLPEDRPVSVHS